MNIKVLLQAVNTTWMLLPSYAESLSLMVHKLFAGEAVDLGDEDEQPKEYAWAVDAKANRIGSVTDAVNNGVAVIELHGAVMKYDYCGSVGTQSLAKALQQANDNPSISAIVFRVDSPGGSVDGTQEFAIELANSKKPVVTFVNGMMCSAAMWLGSSTAFRIASSETATVGSIGTMCSWRDFTAYYDKIGIKSHEVYASDSTQKNIQFREANGKNQDGKSNYEPLIKTWLDPLNGIFTSAIQKNLPNADKTVLNGGHYIASEAMKRGLVDAIGNFEGAVKKALELGQAQQTLTQTQKSNTMKWKNFLGLIGFSTAVGSASEIKLSDANVDSMEAVITELDRFKTSLATITTERDGLQTRVSQLEQTIAANNTKITSLEEEVVKLSKSDGATVSTVISEKDKTGGGENVDATKMDFQKDLYNKI
ncbi:MAG: S49 family peptidase [Chitinophagaceae bacterium]|nr:S49 family peptidase [Chitinophagaceae bacterium]MDP1763433.1 S49 family peptidase [Sediminibacterium sp.]